jgi:hypothetical protein
LLYKNKFSEIKTESTHISSPLKLPDSFTWAGSLKDMDEGLSAVEWQHKISDLITTTDQTQ